jgi:hypothetical protein
MKRYDAAAILFVDPTRRAVRRLAERGAEATGTLRS